MVAVVDSVATAWDVLRDVMDPEIPVLSIVDLGIVRSVRVERDADGSEVLQVTLTPTYSGCPATDVIRGSVERALARAGFGRSNVDTVLSPAWSSDWISEEGRRKLLAFGIAPPSKTVAPCPRCGSELTECISEFGSTPCKAHYRCKECLEPFDRFKCI